VTVRPFICAHRGHCGVAGLPADERYARAIEMGVDYVELDVRRSADGLYVVYHDEATPSGRPTGSLAYADLKAELGPEVLTLDVLFGIVVGRVGMHIDLKEPGYEAEIMALVLARVAPNGFVVTSGDVESIRTIKEQFPTVRAGLTLGTDMRDPQAWATMTERLGELFPGPRLKRSHADFIAAHWRLARSRLLRYSARRRMAAWVWTVDAEADIARFLADPRVTSLITNRPDLALRLRASGGQDGIS
jgi:glycerophosphoryl diester phosphodiesterase